MKSKLFSTRKITTSKNYGIDRYFLLLILTVGCILLTKPAMAAELKIPWGVDLSIPDPSPAYEASWGESFAVPLPFGNTTFDIRFPTEHRPSYQVHLPFELTYTFPDVVAPGEQVAIEADWSFADAPNFTANNSVDYSALFGITVDIDEDINEDGEIDEEDRLSVPLFDLGDLPIPTPLTGTINYTKNTSDVQDTRFLNPYDTDHFGNPWNIPNIPGLTMGPAVKFTTRHAPITPAWNIETFMILDKIGDILPPAEIISLFYDLYVEGTSVTRNIDQFRTGTITSYLTHEGIGPTAYDIVTTSDLLNHHITIPDDIGLVDGDTYEVRIANLGLDYEWMNEFSVLGDFEYGTAFGPCPLCLKFPAFEITSVGFPLDPLNFLPYGEVATFHSQDRLSQGTPLSIFENFPISFTIATEPHLIPPGTDPIPPGTEPIPEPTTIALLGLGLAGLAVVEVRRRRKKKAVDKS